MAFAGITLPNALHESVGFQPLGVFSAAGYKLGPWHDVGWRQHQLRDAPDTPTEPRRSLG